jgi:hypothetical protein
MAFVHIKIPSWKGSATNSMPKLTKAMVTTKEPLYVKNIKTFMALSRFCEQMGFKLDFDAPSHVQAWKDFETAIEAERTKKI